MTHTETVWLFDLDNTLHHADAGIFRLINRAMTDYLADSLNLPHRKASQLREDYWHRYGATLAGLRLHHPEIDIMAFLRASHPMPQLLAALQPMPDTAKTLSALSGRKAVFSNGPSFYVDGLLRALRLDTFFERSFGTDTFGLLYKPNPQAYLEVCRQWSVAPQQCVMVDDSAANLRTAKDLGMMTVWFGKGAHKLPFVDYAAADMRELAAFKAV
ncbi:pyrimidine 5'-nucleotidase [Neisseria sp. ZJ106]|uniref:Pyrimidine 5'-nucleotidase n=1 Tax=Neisseria lisongii TaxID=2912188 RepID=A0ABY7RJ14_9NEIS|nr:pyrimidine 5'-nucleotidase [Neisseria lisongii]MCF7520873.1 pyrimidine 5'-nucleotidase [Neisseria lisongii]WCL71319.1 pyrimidine 5'-nucleotidase [Neisseria lisongii]